MTDLMTRPPQNDHDHDPFGRPVQVEPRDSRWKRRIAGGAAVLALIAGGSATGAFLAENHLTGRPVPAATAATTVTEDANLAPIVAKVQPGIVTVLVADSLGSGVVLTADGLILTNNHVVEGGGTVSVRLSDGRTVPARIAATDAAHDLALVQATGLSGLTPVTFATDDSIAIGDTVLAFGAPLGLEGTVTSGIVSALDRSVDTGGDELTGLLQTDAAINQGNSGGALVDTSGRVVGINVAIATTGDSSGSVGLGFAIPADTATAVVNQLRAQL
ncbi:S1C family serine protease [Actinoplanes italicus]|nr:trypsin-like peptidase domain-containing protein [Actinoplanes italicus]